MSEGLFIQSSCEVFWNWHRTSTPWSQKMAKVSMWKDHWKIYGLTLKNLIGVTWSELLRLGFLENSFMPIVKATNENELMFFCTIRWKFLYHGYKISGWSPQIIWRSGNVTIIDNKRSKVQNKGAPWTWANSYKRIYVDHCSKLKNRIQTHVLRVATNTSNNFRWNCKQKPSIKILQNSRKNWVK